MPCNHSSRNSFVLVLAWSLSAASLGIAAQKDAAVKSLSVVDKPATPVLVSGASKPDQIMSNADVLAMLAAKLSVDIVVEQIRRAESATFDLTTNKLIELKKQGATDEILKAMMSKRDTHVVAPTIVATAVSTPAGQPASVATPTAAEGTSESNNVTADGEPCMVNFSATGSLMSARTAKDFQDYPRGNKGTVFAYLVQGLTSHGDKIRTSSIESGLISTESDVRFGKGETTTTNVLVTEQATGGLRVEITYRVPFGVTFNRSKIQNQMCTILQGVPR